MDIAGILGLCERQCWDVNATFSSVTVTHDENHMGVPSLK